MGRPRNVPTDDNLKNEVGIKKATNRKTLNMTLGMTGRMEANCRGSFGLVKTWDKNCEG